jgi:hypothetical protein
VSGQSFSLSYLGFDQFFAHAAADLGVESAQVGRVVEEQRDAFLVRGESGEVWARLSGRFAFAVSAPHGRPAVGDFVVLRPAEAGIEHA